jgi:hypothetical protein
MSETDIQMSMGRAAEMLTGTDPDNWGAWLTYLLQTLDPAASDSDFRAVLTDLQRDIRTRLDTGRW